MIFLILGQGVTLLWVLLIVPIKRGVVEAIGAATPMGKGKKKKIKQEAVKRAELKGSVEGTEAGSETKKGKTAKSYKQLVVFEEPERVDPSTVGKEVGHPLIQKIQVKTKVKSYVFQVPVNSSAHGSSRSLDLTPQSPLGPCGHTRSR